MKKLTLNKLVFLLFCTFSFFSTHYVQGQSQHEIRDYILHTLDVNGDPDYNIDVKGYTIKTIPPHQMPGGNVESYLVVGTLFEDQWADGGHKIGKGIHCMLVGGTGGVINTTGGVQYNFLYDDPDYDDERLVDVIPGFFNSYLVCQVRDKSTKQYAVKIITIQTSDGAIMRDDVVYGTSASEPYYNLFALDAVLNGQNILFCGYGTGSASTAQPDFYTEKVMIYGSYDINNFSSGVVMHNTAYPSGVTNSNVDFDIAMRIKIMGPDIYLLGSCNTVDASNTAVSGSFVALVSTNLGIWPVIGLNDATYPNPEDKFEYAYDLVKSSDGLFVYSNKYGYGQNPNLMPNEIWKAPNSTHYTGFHLYSAYPMITHLELPDPNNVIYTNNNIQTFDIASGLSRRSHIYPTNYPYPYADAGPFGGLPFSAGWAWGNMLLPTPNSGVNPNEVIIAGLHGDFDRDPSNSCYPNASTSGGFPYTSSNGNHAPHIGNVLPFLTHVVPSWDPNTGSPTYGLSTAVNSWKIHHSQNYWAPVGVDHYFNMGGGLSNLSWLPDFATVQGVHHHDIMMVSMRYTATTGLQNPNGHTIPTEKMHIKFTRTDPYGDISTAGVYECDNSIVDCIPQNVETVDIRNGFDDMGYLWLGVINTSTKLGFSFRSSDVVVDDHLTCSNTGFYKPSSVTGLNKQEVSIYPNPAYNEINIQFEGNNANTRAYITDINGRVLIETKLENSNSKLNITQLVPGVYNIRVVSKGEVVKNQNFVKQ